ncbi:hypothetical protein D3C71_79400 [compost metagenome]
MIPDAVMNIGLGGVRKVADALRASTSDSLISYTRPTRVEPITLLDADLVYHEGISDVMQSLQSIFTGYYMQAVAISTNVGRIDVTGHLDRLNPNRDVGGNAASSMGWLLAAENYKDRLPTYSNPIAMEAIGDDMRELKDRAYDNFKSKVLEPGEEGAGFGKDAIKDAKEVANLSVGKLVEITLQDGNHKASIPVSIRLMVSAMPSESLVHILSLGGKDVSAKGRWHAWRAGRLEFIKDLILCQDLITAHRSNLIKDKDGVYTAMTQRASGNKLSTLLSGNPSVATASNLVVISRETANRIELDNNMKFSRFQDREKLFKPTYVMILAVVDKQWERVTFYHRSVNGETTVSMRDLKISNRGSGPDVSDILKAYQLGNAPSIG